MWAPDGSDTEIVAMAVHTEAPGRGMVPVDVVWAANAGGTLHKLLVSSNRSLGAVAVESNAINVDVKSLVRVAITTLPLSDDSVEMILCLFESYVLLVL